MSDDSGQGNPIPLIIISATIIVPISTISLYKLICFHRSLKTKKQSKFTYINEIIFYISCIVFGFAYPFGDIFIYLSIPWRIIFAIESLTHGLLHFYSLINIFYTRLINVFGETELALTRKTKIIFNTFYILMIFIGVMSWLVFQVVRGQPGSTIIIAIMAMPYLLIMIGITQFLSFMFVFKLSRINRITDASMISRIAPVIRRFTVLNVIAMSGTLFYIMFIGMSQNINSNIPQWFINAMKQIDLITNLVCLTLSYEIFNKYYNTCCFVCDGGVKHCPCCHPSSETQLTLSVEQTQTTKSTNLNDTKFTKQSPQTHVIDREKFLNDNELNDVIDIFIQHDILIEDLINFTVEDLCSFADENGLNTLQKNRLLKGIQELKLSKGNESYASTERSVKSVENSNQVSITPVQSLQSN